MRGVQGEGMCVHIELMHLVLQQKLAQHCKATIPAPPCPKKKLTAVTHQNMKSDSFLESLENLAIQRSF